MGDLVAKLVSGFQQLPNRRLDLEKIKLLGYVDFARAFSPLPTL